MRRSVVWCVLVGVASATVAISTATAQPTTQRLSGDDRFGTAAAISRSAFNPGVDVVFVATGDDFPDALAGGPPGSLLVAPILLVRRDTVPQPTADELQRLAPNHIVVLGGPGVVTDSTLDGLRPYARVDVTRVAGNDRFETAAAVSARYFDPGLPVVFVTTGLSFPDAVTAGSSGAPPYGGPVLLVTSTDIPPATDAELRRLQPQFIVVVGGPASVSADVEQRLSGYGAGVGRTAGDDRYATAALLADDNHPDGSASVVAIASGQSFPDGLAAGPEAGFGGAALLLSGRDCLPPATDRELRRLHPDRVLVLGGPSVLSPAVEQLQPCAPPATDLGVLAHDLFDRVNSERQARGLPAYAWDDGLAAVAQDNANRKFSPPSNEIPNDPRVGCCVDLVSQYDSFYKPYGTSGATHQGFMALEESGGASRYILQEGFQVAGVGVSCDGNTGALTVIEYYGRRKGAGTRIVDGQPPVGPPVRTDPGLTCP